jgi:hypothetical protein
MGAKTQKVFETRRRREPGITRKPKLSRMFQGSAKALDRLFRALASEPRREILRLARSGELRRHPVRRPAQDDPAGSIETHSRLGCCRDAF